MDTAPATDGLAPTIRFLKWLVILLAVTMIVGVIMIVSLIVTRMPQTLRPEPAPAAEITLPASVALPAGTEARAITQSADWIAVVTTDDRILIFTPDGGTLRQEIAITRP
ncbi:DUF6476 family protein [Paracoccaceae bacterium Fryx2]|nr:DUF6476 family protein [Paracoccaceae bacterium Fryx2]